MVKNETEETVKYTTGKSIPELVKVINVNKPIIPQAKAVVAKESTKNMVTKALTEAYEDKKVESAGEPKMVSVSFEMVKSVMPFSLYNLRIFRKKQKIMKPDEEVARFNTGDTMKSYCSMLCWECACYGLYCHDCSYVDSHCTNCCDYDHGNN